MPTYYNEIDQFCCGWLRNLIRKGLIGPGHIDSISIEDVQRDDLDGYDRCHFFAGIGGWDLALQLAEWPDELPVWSGSCPCQPFSTAGSQKGVADDRHLWPEFLRLIRECRPPVVLGEQVASRLGREWLAGVCADLEALGYAVGAADLCAAGIGAPHIRQRLYWVAHAAGERLFRRCKDAPGIDPGVLGPGFESDCGAFHGHRISAEPSAFPLVARIPADLGRGKPELRSMVQGARRNQQGRLSGYGNAIVPELAATFIRSALEAMTIKATPDTPMPALGGKYVCRPLPVAVVPLTLHFNHKDSNMPVDHLEELSRRQSVVRDRVRGVALRHHPGFYLFGRAGTAKTYSVCKTLDEEGCKYHYHSGHLTPMGLFDLLAEYYDCVIVLDDVSELFAQRIALQLLLAALGNQPGEAGVRIIKYRRQGREITIRFTGGIIMISNLELHAGPVLDALKSRIHCLRHNPSDEQIAALMRAIAAKGWPAANPKLAPDECLEVADFLIAESLRLGGHLDLRLLVDKAFPDYLQHQDGDAETHWKDLIRTTLEEQVVDLKHTAIAKATRKETKDQEHELIRELLDQYETREERVAAWESETGKSERAFYRRLEEIGGGD